MSYSVREMHIGDATSIVNYFWNTDADILYLMGADPNKFPPKEEWEKLIINQLELPYDQKEFYYIIWLLDDLPIGHSSINKINFGESAYMHLHVWDISKRKSGLGYEFLKLSIPIYFEKFNLKQLICEPNTKNIAPNQTLKKVGFEFIKEYDTVPGWINYYQTVNRYILTKNVYIELNDE